MEEFRKDARNVKLRIGDHFIEDVTDVLKRFFREVDDPIFMADLHPLWQEAASESTSLRPGGSSLCQINVQYVDWILQCVRLSLIWDEIRRVEPGFTDRLKHLVTV